VKKLGLILLLTLAFAQVQAQENLPSYDRQRLRFGFSLGFNSSNLKVFTKPNYFASDTLYSIAPSAGPGFNIGIVSNLMINRYMDLRFTPNLAFVDRKLSYQFADVGKNTTRNIESTYVDLPLTLKLRTIRHRNVGFYVIGGIKYSYDVISQKKVEKGEDPFDEATRKVKLTNQDLSYEWGFGWDFYYQYFKFSPEIKFSYGTRDLFKPETHLYSRPIDRILSRAIVLTFYFE
jgi:Outer membrane protein beta-barrel domain